MTVLEFIPIPEHNSQDSLHQSLVLFSQQARQLATSVESSEKELHDIEEEIDRKAAEL